MIEFNKVWANNQDCATCSMATYETEYPLCTYHKNRLDAQKTAEAPAQDMPGNNEHHALFQGVNVEVTGGDPKVREKLQAALQATMTDEFRTSEDLNNKINDTISKVIGDSNSEDTLYIKDTAPVISLKDEIIEFLSVGNPKEYIRKRMIKSLRDMVKTISSMLDISVVYSMSGETRDALADTHVSLRDLIITLSHETVEPVDPANPPAPFNASPELKS